MDHLSRNINWAKPGKIEDACPEMGSRLKIVKKLSKFIVTSLAELPTPKKVMEYFRVTILAVWSIFQAVGVFLARTPKNRPTIHAAAE